jgi:hypothetical protein
VEDFQLLLLLMELLKEETKYWPMWVPSRCMANKENICLGCNSPLYMVQTNFK